MICMYVAPSIKGSTRLARECHPQTRIICNYIHKQIHPIGATPQSNFCPSPYPKLIPATYIPNSIKIERKKKKTKVDISIFEKTFSNPNHQLPPNHPSPHPRPKPSLLHTAISSQPPPSPIISFKIKERNFKCLTAVIKPSMYPLYF